MNALDGWLKQATRHLSKDSVARVRAEIQEHFESTRDASIAEGAAPEAADRFALNALGDAKTANRQYRRVLLTSAEARTLRSDNWEARAFCSRSWLKWTVLAVFVGLLGVAVKVGRDALAMALAVSPFCAALFLPIRTAAQGRVFRVMKWVARTIAFALVFGPDALKWSWLLISCLWPLVWSEWTRVSIRRKLPVTAWPRQLYL
jgi:hypothetical protein